LEAGVIASIEVGDSEGSRSYRSGDGTALYGTCLPVTGREGEALGMFFFNNYEPSNKSTCDALTQRRGSIIGQRGRK